MDEDQIAEQQQRLATYQWRLAYQLRQQAVQGSSAPFSLAEDIHECRASIRRIKATLRALGATAADHPDDDQADEPPDATPKHQPIFFIPNNLPASYVERADTLAVLRTALLSSRTFGSRVAVTALHGLGGLGKTVLARAICDDAAVRAAFPDGILWPTLGQRAEPARQQRDWISALGGDLAAASSLERGVVELRRLLERRAMLMRSVWGCAFGPDGRLALSVAGDRSIRLWDVLTGAEIAHWQADAPLFCCAFHPDGRGVIAGDSMGNLHWLRLEHV
jgi:hypothetical protein